MGYNPDGAKRTHLIISTSCQAVACVLMCRHSSVVASREQKMLLLEGSHQDG